MSLCTLAGLVGWLVNGTRYHGNWTQESFTKEIMISLSFLNDLMKIFCSTTLGMVGKRYSKNLKHWRMLDRNFGLNGHCLSSISPLASGVWPLWPKFLEHQQVWQVWNSLVMRLGYLTIETQNAPVLGTMLNLKITSTVPIWGKFHSCLLWAISPMFSYPKCKKTAITTLKCFAFGWLLVKRNRPNTFWWFRIPFQWWSGWWFQPIWKISVKLEIFPK